MHLLKNTQENKNKIILIIYVLNTYKINNEISYIILMNNVLSKKARITIL